MYKLFSLIDGLDNIHQTPYLLLKIVLLPMYFFYYFEANNIECNPDDSITFSPKMIVTNAFNAGLYETKFTIHDIRTPPTN